MSGRCLRIRAIAVRHHATVAGNPRHPFGARQLALKCIRSPRRLAIRINMQHDTRDFLPVRTFRVRVEQPLIR
jgi:hypothetical protein